MLLKEEMIREELLDYLYQFGESYEDSLENTELRYIFKNCELGNYVDKVPYILTQFYSEYNLLDDDKNIYLYLLKKIKECFSIESKKILEVGGGPTPQLGKLLAKEANEVTVMDTNISIKNNKLNNLYLYHNYFLPFTDISKYDLVVAYMACGTAESIITNCAKNNKDFFIGLCPCGKDAMNEVMSNKLTSNQYINGIINYANKKVKENNLGILKIEEPNKGSLFEFPIIYNKRTKIIKYKRDVE